VYLLIWLCGLLTLPRSSAKHSNPSDRNKMQFKDKKLTKIALIFNVHENTVFPMDIAVEEINFQITLIVQFFFSGLRLCLQTHMI